MSTDVVCPTLPIENVVGACCTIPTRTMSRPRSSQSDTSLGRDGPLNLMFGPRSLVGEDGECVTECPSLNSAYDRLCPGMHVADATLFIAVASILATYTVEKVVRNGVPITPTVAQTSGVIRYDSLIYEFIHYHVDSPPPQPPSSFSGNYQATVCSRCVAHSFGSGTRRKTRDTCMNARAARIYVFVTATIYFCPAC